ncbi:MAG: hypothetical protein OQK46_01820 [Gammaproteobacteria bacterium]|nr:hypothetical protein [Gammaproteobacteria bacterium]
MTDQNKKHAGIIQALIQEFELHRLPCLLCIKDKLDNGDVLSDGDIEFLHRVIDDARRTIPLTIYCTELHDFCMCVVSLFRDLTERALENQTKKVTDSNRITIH